MDLYKAACVLHQHPGIIRQFRASGWNTAIGEWPRIVEHWWYSIKPPESLDPRFPNLESYAAHLGCMGAGWPATSDEAKCWLDKNPGIKKGYFDAWTDEGPNDWPNMLLDWFVGVTDGDQSIHGQYDSIHSYLVAIGCRSAGALPAPGFGPLPGWTPPPPPPGPVPAPVPVPIPLPGGLKIDTRTMLLLGAGLFAVLMLRK